MTKTALIADIGGTNARFGVVDKDGLHDVKYLPCKDYDGPVAAASDYLSQVQGHNRPEAGVFAVAAPLSGDFVKFTSNSWAFSGADVQAELGFRKLDVMNDFTAVAMAVPHLPPALLEAVTDAAPQDFQPKVVIGPGTGLGVASLAWSGTRYITVPGEGGHVTMPATTQREFNIFEHLRGTYPHISAERVCSGNGLVNIYTAIRALDGRYDLPDLGAADISKRAIDGTCQVAKESLDLMLAFLGRVAGNLALNTSARGGVYIAGGIPTKLGDYFAASKFREEFNSKGRMTGLMAEIPVFIIKHDAPALLALEKYAQQQLL